MKDAPQDSEVAVRIAAGPTDAGQIIGAAEGSPQSLSCLNCEDESRAQARRASWERREAGLGFGPARPVGVEARAGSSLGSGPAGELGITRGQQRKL